MAIRRNRRVTAGLLAVSLGLLAPFASERVLAHQLGLAGPPVAYGICGLTALAAVAAFRYSSARSWRSLLVYAALAAVSALGSFGYLFGTTRA